MVACEAFQIVNLYFRFLNKSLLHIHLFDGHNLPSISVLCGIDGGEGALSQFVLKFVLFVEGLAEDVFTHCLDKLNYKEPYHFSKS